MQSIWPWIVPRILKFWNVQEHKRVVITADLDYSRLLAITRAEGPGLILFRGGNFSDQETFERMERVLETTTPEYLGSSIVVIEKEKIRRRRLPL